MKADLTIILTLQALLTWGIWALCKFIQTLP